MIINMREINDHVFPVSDVVVHATSVHVILLGPERPAEIGLNIGGPRFVLTVEGPTNEPGTEGNLTVSFGLGGALALADAMQTEIARLRAWLAETTDEGGTN